MMEEFIIRLVNLKKSYNHRVVLNIPELKILKNKLHIVLGANGSGKTTLLETIAGLNKIDGGSIYYEGKVANLKILREKTTLVLQSPYLFNTTVFNNIAYGLKVRGIRETEITDRVKTILEGLGLEGYAQRNARELSQGEMRLVAIGRALVLEREVLLLDEPCSDLDRQNIQLIEQILKQTKRTIVMATQSANQAHRLAEILITIKNGVVKVAKKDFRANFGNLES